MISIITSLYKSEKYLPTFLKSAKKLHSDLQKSGMPFEHLIIANDVSSAETSLLKESGLTFTIITVPRETLYASWNRGVHESKFPYATFWAVDDTRFAKAIRNGVKTLELGFDATYFPYIYKRYIYLLGVKILASVRIVQPREYDRDLFLVGMYAGPHFIFRTSLFSTIGKFNESFKIAGDFDWWVRLTEDNGRIKKMTTLSGVFTNDGKTLSGSKNDLQKEENARAINQK
jgi:glycosyltransferase involved in cell wall biosynthesis